MAELFVDRVLDARGMTLTDIDVVRFGKSATLILNADQIGPGQVSNLAQIIGLWTEPLPPPPQQVGRVDIKIYGAVDLSGWQFSGWRSTMAPGRADFGSHIITIIADQAPSTIVGSPFDDVIEGSDFDDVIDGRGGGDFISAGAGNDRVAINHVDGLRFGFRLDGGAGIDTLVVDRSLSSAAFTMMRDTAGERLSLQGATQAFGASNFEIVHAIGGSGNDQLIGLDRADVLIGMDGNDKLIAYLGDDSLDGGNGADYLNGGEGNDSLAGGAGGDTLDGEGGFDFAAYHGANAGILADLQFATVNTGDATGDIYYRIEGLTGSQFGDSLRGDAQDNWIYGNLGADLIYGRDGNDVALGGEGDDVLFGENGADYLLGGQGNDHLHGNSGADNLNGDEGLDYARYDYASSGLTVDLLFAASQNTGEAAGDVFSQIEGLVGSAFADELRGDLDDNQLWGGADDDTLYGRDGKDLLIGDSGNDQLIGGTGQDTFFFSGAFGSDTIFDFSSGNGPGDQLWLNLGPAFDSYAEVMAAASPVGNDTLLSFSPDQSVLILGVQRWDLAIDDFRFA